MKHFKPNSKANWVLEVNRNLPYKGATVCKQYVWERRSKDGWQVILHNVGLNGWEYCDGMTAADPRTWDEEAEFVNIFSKEEVFIMIL